MALKSHGLGEIDTASVPFSLISAGRAAERRTVSDAAKSPPGLERGDRADEIPGAWPVSISRRRGAVAESLYRAWSKRFP